LFHGLLLQQDSILRIQSPGMSAAKISIAEPIKIDFILLLFLGPKSSGENLISLGAFGSILNRLCILST
jgi:hypothetical protein